MDELRFAPEEYRRLMDEIPAFDDLQEAVATATAGADVRRALELGTGTGETARRVMHLHAAAALTGIDSSAEMLGAARAALPGADLVVARLEDPLPTGPFDLVFSALAVHHLAAEAKRSLFRRVRAVLRPGGRFVLGDVVVPEDGAGAPTPLTPGFDLPDSVADQLAWLGEAGFDCRLVWSRGDLAVVRADAA